MKETPLGKEGQTTTGGMVEKRAVTESDGRVDEAERGRTDRGTTIGLVRVMYQYGPATWTRGSGPSGKFGSP